MTDPILIGIHGVKRAGKDTTADFITEFVAENFPALAVGRRGFADKAKLAFARQFFPKITTAEAVAWVDKNKDDNGMRVVVEHNKRPVVHQADVQFRQCMAQFATEGARDIYGYDFWVDQLLPLSQSPDPLVIPDWSRNFAQWQQEPPEICLITDLRFDNEVARIRTLGGFCWKVRRKEAEDAVIAEAAAAGREIHASELGLPDHLFDVVLDAEGRGLEHFRHLVNTALMIPLRMRRYD